MLRRRFSRRSGRRASGGFTLIEVLLAIATGAILVLAVGSSVVWVTSSWADHRARLQTQESLRSAVADLSRETRLAGACMFPYWTGTAPPVNFRPVDGINNGTTDTIIVRSNPFCGQATLTGSGCNQCGAFTVDNIANFQVGTWAYFYNSANTQYFHVTSISGNTITVDPATPITANYPAGTTTVYGADQRVFAISSTCTGCGGIPTLTLQVLGQPAQPLVKGIDALDIHYILNRTYSASTCDLQTGGTPNLCIVNLPGTGSSPVGDWQIVRVVTFTVDARSITTVAGAGSPDGFFHLGAAFEIAPRNFVFNQQNGGRL